MKDLQEMTQNEFFNFCVEMKLKGVSYTDIVKMMDKKGIEPSFKKEIIGKLEKIDKKQNEILEDAKKKTVFKKGIIQILIGIGILLFGLLIFNATSKIGKISILNILFWVASISLVFMGVLNIIFASIKKK